jgi:hypothetical protein
VLTLVPRVLSSLTGGSSVGGSPVRRGDSSGSDELGPSFSHAEQERATEFLQQWLFVEAGMEDTIDVLERDGWF